VALLFYSILRFWGLIGQMKKTTIFSVILMLIFNSCIVFEPALSTINAGEGINARQTETPAGFGSLEGIDCIPDISTVETARVVRVIDGDSIEVVMGEETYQVRYIGINTPEYYSSDRQRAEEATRVNQDLVEGKTIFLFKDQSETDKYDRLLRYVVTKDAFVNLELVRSGYAEAREYPPDTACHQVFKEADLNH